MIECTSTVLLTDAVKPCPYKPRTGRTGHTSQCMNHAPAILAAPALIYSMHRVFIVWIIVAHFHLCSLLGTVSHYTVLEVRRPMHVCCGSQWGRCVLFIGACFSLTFWTVWRLLVWCMYNTVYGRSGKYDRCMVYTLASAWFIWTRKTRCQWRYIRGMVLRCKLQLTFQFSDWNIGSKMLASKKPAFFSPFQSKNGNKYSRWPLVEPNVSFLLNQMFHSRVTTIVNRCPPRLHSLAWPPAF